MTTMEQLKDLNKEVVVRYYKNIMNEGKISEIDEIFSNDVLVKGAGLHIQGKEALKEHIERLKETLPKLTYTMNRYIAEENKVAVIWSYSAIDQGYLQNRPPKGKKFTNQGINIFRLKDGKINRITYQQDSYGVLRQLDAIPNVLPALEASRMDIENPEQFDNTRGGTTSISPSINKELIRRYTDSIMCGNNIRAGSEFMSDDCTSRLLSYFMTEPLKGANEWTGMVEVLHKGIPNLKVVINEEVAEYHTVAVKWTALGTNTDILMGNKASNMPIALEGISWYRIADEKIVENLICEDQAGLLKQIGVLHMPLEKDKAAEYNKSIMYKFFDGVWNHADLSLIDQYVDKNMIQHIPGEGNGTEGFRETAQKYHASFTDMDLHIEDEIVEGDRVVHRWKWVCTHSDDFNGIPATGKRVSFTGMTITRLKEGKIIEHWSNVDAVSLLMQLGAIPSP